MAISDIARVNHERLFPGHGSGLAVTDPELIEVFDNFAFDEVWSHSDLDAGTRMMTLLAALIASGGVAEYRVVLGAALSVGVTPVQAKEVLYQAVPYVGMGRVFDFLHVTNVVLTDRGIDLPLPGQSTTTPETRHTEGSAVQTQIIGAQAVAEMHAAAFADEAHIQRYLSGNCFGDYLTRSGLDLRTRELLTFSMLAALGGCEAQLRGHITGNHNVGNDRSVLLAVLTALLPFIGYPRTLNALRVLDDTTPAN